MAWKDYWDGSWYTFKLQKNNLKYICDQAVKSMPIVLLHECQKDFNTL